MLTTRLAAILIPLILAPPTAPASTIPVNGGVLLSIRQLITTTTFTDSKGQLLDVDFTEFIDLPDRAEAEALIHEPGKFASALADAGGNLEVGVGGEVGLADSSSIYEQFITNLSPNPFSGKFRFTIPAGQIVLTDFFSGNHPGSPIGGVLAQIEFGFGSEPLREIFAFGTEVRVDGGVIVNENFGPIVTRSTVDPRGQYRVSIDKFEGTLDFPDIAPEETLHIVYTMNAFGSGDVAEFVYSVRLGDPLDFTAGGSAGIVFDPAAAAVPEPASLLLCGLGFAILAAMGRRGGGAKLT